MNVKTLFRNSKTIAIVGCSPNEYRTSNFIAKFMQDKGYTIIPVNPTADEILGENSYDNLNDISSDTNIHIVNIFRDSSHTAGVVEDVINRMKNTGQKPVIWTQLDVSSPEAEALAKENDLEYVKNQCIMVEWERYNR